MKLAKVFIGVLFIYNCIGIKCYGQSYLYLWSDLHITIDDTNDQKFLDSVEAKLLKVVNKNDGEVTLFNVSPAEIRLGPQEWRFPGAWGGVPKNSMCTHTYLLSIRWNPELDSGTIIGFSEMYYHYFEFMQSQHLYSFGPYCYPLYTVLLDQYNSFLSKNEMKRMRHLVQRSLMAIINEGEYRYNPVPPLAYYLPKPAINDTLTQRNIRITRDDSILPEFSLSYWSKVLKHTILNADITTYSKPIDGTGLTRWECEDMFQKRDTIRDGKNNTREFFAICPIGAISVSEKWQIKNYLITKKIIAIGLNTYCPDEIGNGYKEYATGWVNYKDIEKTADLNQGKLSLWKEVINSELYKKLNIQYPDIR